MVTDNVSGQAAHFVNLECALFQKTDSKPRIRVMILKHELI